MMEKQRSVGIIILGIIYLVIGIISLLILPLFSILYLICGIGIFMLKPFARYLGISTSILGIVVNTVKIIRFLNKPMPEGYMSAFIGTYLIHSLIIFYLTRPKVKEQFR